MPPCRIDTLDELEYFRHGGILPYVLRAARSGGKGLSSALPGWEFFNAIFGLPNGFIAIEVGMKYEDDALLLAATTIARHGSEEGLAEARRRLKVWVEHSDRMMVEIWEAAISIIEMGTVPPPKKVKQRARKNAALAMERD
jgi:hypothetical protein